MKKLSKSKIESGILSNIVTETRLRKWKRRLIVALTVEARQKALAKIKEYSK